MQRGWEVDCLPRVSYNPAIKKKKKKKTTKVKKIALTFLISKFLFYSHLLVSAMLQHKNFHYEQLLLLCIFFSAVEELSLVVLGAMKGVVDV